MHFNCKEMNTVKEGLAGFTDGGGGRSVEGGEEPRRSQGFRVISMVIGGTVFQRLERLGMVVELRPSLPQQLRVLTTESPS